MIALKVLQPSNWSLEGSLFWGYDRDFQGHRNPIGQIRFPEHNSNILGAIGFKLGTEISLASGSMVIHFGVATWNFVVTECEKVNNYFWCHSSISI